MKLFTCQHCGQLLYFENTGCERCGRALGFLPELATLSALEQEGELWRALAAPAKRYRACANAIYDACNWQVEADAEGDYCVSCQHNRTVPDLSVAENVAQWRKLQLAKNRLMYTILKLGLPHPTEGEDEARGLGFDFLADPPQPTGDADRVMTGHANGLITIALAEADDAERERRRTAMGEPYRTLLGHLRHEVGHYYWDRLVADRGAFDAFRAMFGDERQDYGEALKAHYARNLADRWDDAYVSSYARAHPWEDFAETWAHYLHIIDTLETARRISDPGGSGGGEGGRPIGRGRLRRLYGPGHRADRRGVAAAVVRGQQPQPQHGLGRPLSVRPVACRDREAGLHPPPRPPARLRARARHPSRNGAVRP